MVAATRGEGVSHLVMLNAIYGMPGAWSLRSRLEDPERPGQLRPLGAHSLRDAASLLRTWDANIPVEDKASWRDPRVAAAYAAVAIAGDPTATTREPPSMRVPSGPLHDSYLLAGGTKLWDAGAVRAATLVMRSELDFWSRPEDVAALRAGARATRRDRRVAPCDARGVPRSARARPNARRPSSGGWRSWHASDRSRRAPQDRSAVLQGEDGYRTRLAHRLRWIRARLVDHTAGRLLGREHEPSRRTSRVRPIQRYRYSATDTGIARGVGSRRRSLRLPSARSSS
jgi:hypothetical protein